MKGDGLTVDTRLDTTEIKGRILRRERLLSILKKNLDKKLILVCADAGYGKTTLLAQFCNELKEPFIFYDLSSRDNDTATFFDKLIRGIQKYVPGFGTRVSSVVDEKRDPETIVGTFINEFLENLNGEFYIILDDYHRLSRNRPIVKIVNYFLRHLPANLHFVISSRTTPPIYLSYYLAKQELLHLGKEHLQFDLEETHNLLRKVYGMDIQEDDIARIAEISEGWVTVIQLMLQKISVAGSEQVRQTLSNYIASGEDVFDYFTEEVFDNQPREICDFLVNTSILEYLNPAVCDQILGIKGSNKIIADLESEHIFVIRSGDNLIYHPLFQEFLYKRLSDAHNDKYIRKLHRRASEYFYRKKEYRTAVRHLIGARRYGRAAAILYKHYDHWHDANEFELYIQLVDSIPAKILERYPYLMLKKAWMYSEMKKIEQSLKAADKALRCFRRAHDRRGMSQVYILKWHAHHLLMQSRKGLYYAKKAYRLAGKRRSRDKAVVMLNLGTAYRVSGMFAKARQILDSALSMARSLKDRHLECDALHMLAMLYYNMSDLVQAERTFTEIANKFRDHIYPLELGYIYRSIASIAVDNGDVVKAEEYIERAERIVEQYNDRYLAHYLVLLRGRMNVFKGNYERAIAFFKQVIELNRKIDVKISDLYALLDLVDVYLRMNDVRRARDSVDGARAVLDQSQDIPQHTVAFKIAQGRVETAEHKFSAARKSLDEALDLSARVFDPSQVLMIYYAYSEHYLARRAMVKALEWFKKCLVLAEKHEFGAFLVSIGRDEVELFHLALEEDYHKDFILTILHRIDTDRAREISRRFSVTEGKYDLECNYLGRLEIRGSDARVVVPKWRTNRARTLFIMLSANHPRGCTKKELLDACWPKKDAEQAIHSLQVEVSSVRKILQDVLGKRFDHDNLIICRAGKYSLNPVLAIKKDIQQFEALVHEASLRESADPAASIKLYGQACGMYRGDFCSNLSFDWCAANRSYYRGIIMKVLKKMASLHYGLQEHDKALKLYQQAAALDQYDEAIHIGIMRCLFALRDADGVQRQYGLLARMLRELDIPQPSVEATEIYKASLH